MTSPLVFIASPYSSDPVHGTRSAIDAWMMLRNHGITALVPHVSMLLDLVYPLDAADWYAYDLELLDHCDALLRLPGRSAGADREVQHAEEMGLDVFHGVGELLEAWGA